jgi:DNA-binding NtrC family response regulator
MLIVGSVLLYQDDPTLGAFVAEVLSDEGHQVQVCTSLEDVRSAAIADPTALVLVDTWDVSFYALDTEQRQAIRAFAAQVPTVMLTAHAWASDTKAEELGLLALLPMPIDLDLLVETVSRQVAGLVARCQAVQERSLEVELCSR